MNQDTELIFQALLDNPGQLWNAVNKNLSRQEQKDKPRAAAPEKPVFTPAKMLKMLQQLKRENSGNLSGEEWAYEDGWNDALAELKKQIEAQF